MTKRTVTLPIALSTWYKLNVPIICYVAATFSFICFFLLFLLSCRTPISLNIHGTVATHWKSIWKTKILNSNRVSAITISLKSPFKFWHRNSPICDNLRTGMQSTLTHSQHCYGISHFYVWILSPNSCISCRVIQRIVTNSISVLSENRGFLEIMELVIYVCVQHMLCLYLTEKNQFQSHLDSMTQNSRSFCRLVKYYFSIWNQITQLIQIIFNKI